MSSTDVVEKKKTWPVDGGRHARQHASYFRKKKERKKENALPKGKDFVESSSELFDIYNVLWV